jgi:hypothetical protein
MSAPLRGSVLPACLDVITNFAPAWTDLLNDAEGTGV